MRRRRAAGFTLVELVMAIIVISIAVTGILLAYVTVVLRSADPMLGAQAVAIAEGYMDEILAKSVCGSAGGGGRANFACVEDYDGLSEAPTDQFGTPLGLAGYTVQVSATAGSFGAPSPVTGAIVTVTVNYAGGSYVLTGHRANY